MCSFYWLSVGNFSVISPALRKWSTFSFSFPKKEWLVGNKVKRKRKGKRKGRRERSARQAGAGSGKGSDRREEEWRTGKRGTEE